METRTPLPPIREVKYTLTGERREFNCQRLQLDDDGAVVLFVIADAAQVSELVLPAGTLTLGYFWTARNYNLYHWLTPQGRTLGWYFNISDSTLISADQISWRDLVVDLLITPDGRRQVLDREELPADLSCELKRTIDATLEGLQQRSLSDWERIAQHSRQLLRAAGLLRPGP